MRLLCKEDCLVHTKESRGNGWSLVTTILVLFMPKCAFCWAAYMGIFSSIGIVINYQPWFVPMAALLFIITLLKLLIIAVRRKNFISFGLALMAGALIMLQRKVPGISAAKILAIVLMVVAVQMDSLRVVYRLYVSRR